MGFKYFKKKSPISLLESSDCISAVKRDDTLHGLIFWCLMNALVGDLGVIKSVKCAIGQNEIVF